MIKQEKNLGNDSGLEGYGKMKKLNGAIFLLVMTLLIGLVGWFIVYVRDEYRLAAEEKTDQMKNGKEKQAYVLSMDGVVVPDGVTPIPMVLDTKREVEKEGTVIRLLMDKESRYVRVGEDVVKELEGEEYIRVIDYLTGIVLVTNTKEDKGKGYDFKVQSGVVIGKYIRTRPKMSDEYYVDVFAFNSDFRIKVSREEYKAYMETDKVKVLLTDTDEISIVN